MVKQQGLFFDCAISGLEGVTLAVSAFDLKEAYSDLYTLTVDVVSPKKDIDTCALLLKKATLTVFNEGILQRTIEGIVTKANIGKTGFHRTFYTFVIRPRLWLMTQRQNSRIFHHKTIPEVLSQLMDEHHVTNSMQLTKKHSSREYITQKRETDYAFFTRLAAEEGITFWSYFSQNQKIILADDHARLRGGTPITYNPHPQNQMAGNIMHDFSLSNSMTPQKFIGKDRMYEKPAYDYKHHAAKGTLDIDPDEYSIFESYPRFSADEMGEAITDWRLKALQVESEMGKANSNCLALSPGCAFILSDHPNTKLNTNWQIVQSHHKGTMPQVLEEDADGKPATLTNELIFISSNRAWHAPFKHKPIANGPEVAEVVGPPGEEICVNEFGAVKVFFHWNRYDKKDDRASCWVRVAQGWSGQGYGFYAIPRIGQEVIVSYLDGDIDRPIITGSTYNGNMTRPIDMPDNKTQTVFRTKTHKGEGFNEIRFDDVTAKERFFMHAQYNMDTEVRHDRTTQVDRDHTEKVDNNQSITIGVDQTQDIGHDQTETVGNNRTTTIGSNDTLTVKANQTETVFIAKAESIGAAKALTIGAAYQISVGAAMNTSVGLSKSEQVGINKHVVIGKNYSQKINNNKVLSIGQKVTYEVGNEFIVDVGSSKLIMKKNGTIIIKGVKILIDGVHIKNKASDINMN